MRRSRDKGMGTALVLPDETFAGTKVIEIGGKRIELLYLGPAHSPGDISVWLPQQRVVIAGDIAFHQRLLPVFEETDTGAWVETWDKVERQYHLPCDGVRVGVCPELATWAFRLGVSAHQPLRPLGPQRIDGSDRRQSTHDRC